MKIDRIELFHVAIPLEKPFHPARIPGYPQTANRFTLARFTADDGLQGLAAGIAFEHEREGLGGLKYMRLRAKSAIPHSARTMFFGSGRKVSRRSSCACPRTAG